MSFLVADLNILLSMTKTCGKHVKLVARSSLAIEGHV